MDFPYKDILESNFRDNLKIPLDATISIYVEFI